MADQDPSRDDARNLVALTDDGLEHARRAMLHEVRETLEYAARQVGELQSSAWPPGVIADDARATLRMLRRELDAMDALGWPKREDQR